VEHPYHYELEQPVLEHFYGGSEAHQVVGEHDLPFFQPQIHRGEDEHFEAALEHHDIIGTHEKEATKKKTTPAKPKVVG